MQVLSQLLRCLQLQHNRQRRVSTKPHRSAAQVYVWLSLGWACILYGCATPDVEAEFSLDQRDGTPIVDTGREQYQMDWRGQLVISKLGRTPQTQRNTPVTGDSLAILDPETRCKIEPQLAGPVSYVYLAPQAPQGWHTCLAVTVSTEQSAQQPSDNGTAGPPEWIAQLFDVDTQEMLAELELNQIYSSLTYEEPPRNFRAEVRSAYAGPDGGIGLLLWFAQGGEYLLDGGIWDGEEWIPLVCIQPSGGASQDQVIYVGPGNASILQTPYSLFFSAADGRLLNMWILKGSFIHLFQNALIWGLLKALAFAAFAGSMGVAILGLFWQLATARSKRRRQH